MPREEPFDQTVAESNASPTSDEAIEQFQRETEYSFPEQREFADSDSSDGSFSYDEWEDSDDASEVVGCRLCGKYLYNNRPVDDEWNKIVIGECGCELCVKCAMELGGYSSRKQVPRGFAKLRYCLCRQKPMPPPKLVELCVPVLAHELEKTFFSKLPDELGLKVVKNLAARLEKS